MPFRLLSARCLTLALAATGLLWGFLILPKSEISDELRDTGSQLLRGETFTPKALARTVANPVFGRVSDCDIAAQTTLLLMESQVAESRLRGGAVADFDQHAKAIDARSGRVLACAPRQSFVWLIRFGQAVLRGQIDERAFGLLAMSYETSENEGWISIRRNSMAIPLLPVFPEPLKEKVLLDFQRLVRGGFNEESARLYAASSQPARLLLQASVEKLEPFRQKAFWDTLHKIGS